MIDPTEVNKIFMYCLLDDSPEFKEVVDNKPAIGVPCKVVEGITISVCFHTKRLEEKEKEIVRILDELHSTFDDGWSFLNLPIDKHGTQWGEHPNAQELMLLGLATDHLVYCAPRNLWSIMPGSVPYIQRVRKKHD